MNQNKGKMSVGEKISRGIDSVVGVFSPEKACRREAFRDARKQMSAYRGARNTRVTNDWITSKGSADKDNLPALAKLRERSRDLNRNNPYAAGITQTVTNNTIGTGIRPQSRIKHEIIGISPEKAEEFQTKAEAVFHRWSKTADISEINDFYEIQSIVDRQILESGEAFVLPLMVERKYKPYFLSLQMIEADRISNPNCSRGDKSIRSGIKIGKYGEPVEYYIRENHPGDGIYGRSSASWKTYKARNQKSGRKNVIHLYPVQRPGQSRGVPFFAPVMETFQQFDQYIDATLISKRVAACFSVFIKNTSPEGNSSLGWGEVDDNGDLVDEIYPGMVQKLGLGEEIQTANPGMNDQSFDSFTRTMLIMIASALNLPYELVTKDFSKSNYSNTRAALQQAYRYFRYRQQWLGKKLCQPLYEMVIEESVLRGELHAPRFYENKDLYCTAKWIGDGWEWIDPLKEVKAAVEGKKSNIVTLADITGARGQDWEDVLDQIAREKKAVKKLEEKYGIKFDVNKNNLEKAVDDEVDENGEIKGTKEEMEIAG